MAQVAKCTATFDLFGIEISVVGANCAEGDRREEVDNKHYSSLSRVEQERTRKIYEERKTGWWIYRT